jgi:membrane associated rhomboid family serine protease
MFLPLYDNNPTLHTPYVTLLLIAINSGVFIWLCQLPENRRQIVVIEHGFVPKRVGQLSNPKLVVEVPVERQVNGPGGMALVKKIALPPVPAQIYLSALTAMFLHGSWLHLLGNMWYLWLFGNNVEDRLGPLVYLCFYFIGGLIATLCYTVFDPNGTTPLIGASGAIAAVLGAYAVTWPFARVRTLVFLIVFITIWDLPALVVLGFWFLMQLLEAVGAMQLGLNGGDAGIAFWAHVGGFIAGMLLMPLLSTGAPPSGHTWRAEFEAGLR